MNNCSIILPAEWGSQSAVLLTWPHKNTDWHDMLDETTSCYINIACAISASQKLIIVAPNINQVKTQLKDLQQQNIRYFEIDSNDTWARDHGAISVLIDNKPHILDFTFNGWAMKFAANLDNQITKKLVDLQAFTPSVTYKNMLSYILEGGSIESDGEGTILTTSECLLSVNRNNTTKEETEEFLINTFGLKQILWLDYGYLSGDDTDSHIDTLARFCNKQTIAYVKCEDSNDEHFEALKKMEIQLKSFKTLSGEPYKLIALPMANPVYYEGERIPATYANFLIINGAVLMPIYNSDKDSIAIEQMKKAFPDREIIGIDCSALIKQHGSLHCVTMQFPEGFVN